MTYPDYMRMAKIAYECYNRELPDLYPFEKQPPEYKLRWAGLVHCLFTTAEIHRMFMDHYQANWDYQI